MFLRQVQVDRGFFQITMAQENLNRPQIRAGLEQVCGEAVPPMPYAA
jgi:hypothetical protein